MIYNKAMDAQLNSLLVSFGCNIASTFIYDWIKTVSNKKINSNDFIKELALKLECENGTDLAENILELFEQKGVAEVSTISGEISLNVDKAKEVVGVSISKPTRILPGTKISTIVGEADSVIGFEIK